MSAPERKANPTVGDIDEVLGMTYTFVGVMHVWLTPNRALGGRTPAELSRTKEGRQRVYDWAWGLAEGVMG